MTDVGAGKPAGREPAAWRSKWAWVGVYWAAQAAVLHAGWALLTLDSMRRPAQLWDVMTDRDFVALSSIIIGILTAGQWVLLLPMHRPARADGGGAASRVAHCVAAGAAVGGAAWLCLFPLVAIAAWMRAAVVQDWLQSDAVRWSVPIGAALVTGIGLWHRVRDGMPVRLSVVIAAMYAAVLFGGLVGIVWSVPRLVYGDSEWISDVTTGFMCSGVLVAWAGATPVVYSFTRRRGAEDGLARLSSRLLLGTVVEAAAAIPLDVMIRKKTDCYCEEGTYWALSACWGVGAFALGPAIFLVPLSKRRKRWLWGRCEACGYDMTGCMSAERCPECGSGWKAPATARSEGC